MVLQKRLSSVHQLVSVSIRVSDYLFGGRVGGEERLTWNNKKTFLRYAELKRYVHRLYNMYGMF